MYQRDFWEGFEKQAYTGRGALIGGGIGGLAGGGMSLLAQHDATKSGLQPEIDWKTVALGTGLGALPGAALGGGLGYVAGKIRKGANKVKDAYNGVKYPSADKIESMVATRAARQARNDSAVDLAENAVPTVMDTVAEHVEHHDPILAKLNGLREVLDSGAISNEEAVKQFLPAVQRMVSEAKTKLPSPEDITAILNGILKTEI